MPAQASVAFSKLQASFARREPSRQRRHSHRQGRFQRARKTKLNQTLPVPAGTDTRGIRGRIPPRGPGARCGDIATELNEIYRSHGLLGYRSFGYGHSFGVLSHYYGREAGVEVREDVNTVLKPGMVVSMEPMVSIPEGLPGAGGYREHDILVLTEAGAENITKFPFGAEHNIVKR